MEQQNIKTGLEDWNNQPNNSGVRYNVYTTSNPPPSGMTTAALPPPETANTIIARYIDSLGAGGQASLSMRSSGSTVWGELTFYQQLRYVHAAAAPSHVRETARHEGGHGIGLENADNCEPGSSILSNGSMLFLWQLEFVLHDRFHGDFGSPGTRLDENHYLTRKIGLNRSNKSLR
jgi:hypothetical protein